MIDLQDHHLTLLIEGGLADFVHHEIELLIQGNIHPSEISSKTLKAISSNIQKIFYSPHRGDIIKIYGFMVGIWNGNVYMRLNYIDGQHTLPDNSFVRDFGLDHWEELNIVQSTPDMAELECCLANTNTIMDIFMDGPCTCTTCQTMPPEPNNSDDESSVSTDESSSPSYNDYTHIHFTNGHLVFEDS